MSHQHILYKDDGRGKSVSTTIELIGTFDEACASAEEFLGRHPDGSVRIGEVAWLFTFRVTREVNEERWPGGAAQ